MGDLTKLTKRQRAEAADAAFSDAIERKLKPVWLVWRPSHNPRSARP